MRRIILAAALLLAAPPARADYRYIGPWFLTASVNSANDQRSLEAGQNNELLGIRFTCFDRHLTLGVWQPGRSLRMPVAARAAIDIKVDVYDPIKLVGIATSPALAEFDQTIGLVMREMLAGRRAEITFTPHVGPTIRTSFGLDNAGIAFADISRNCAL